MAQTMQAHRCSMCDASSSIGKSLGCCDAARSIESGRVGQHDQAMEGRSGQRAEPVEAPKSSEAGSWGSLRRPNQSKWVDRGRSRRPRSLEFARGERPGASEGAPKRPKSTPSRDGERRTRQFGRMARSRTIVGVLLQRNVRLLGVVAMRANPPKYRACQQKRRFGISFCTSRWSHDLPSKNDQNRSQNRSKVNRSGSFGVCRGAQVDRSWSFGSVEAPKSIEVARSGSVEAAKVARGQLSLARNGRAG